MNLIKSRLLSPYTEQGKTQFPHRNKTGTYLIYENEELKYVGQSVSCVYKALYRHFQKWEGGFFGQKRCTYSPDRCKVRVIYTRTAAQAEALETALIVKYQPKDNENKLKKALEPKEVVILQSFEYAQVSPVSMYDGSEEAPF